jgi:hypothetical protein
VTELYVSPDGNVRCLYSEAINLGRLGVVRITRASRVEPSGDSRWTADLSPVGGPTLGPFSRRSVALAAEAEWLREQRLAMPLPL